MELIQSHIDAKKFEFGIIYGRRRIGKTTILKELVRRNRGIYFFASEMDYGYNLSELSRAVAEHYGEAVTFDSLEMIFEYLHKKSLSERVLLIIDEFTYLFAKEPGIMSLLQRIIDSQLVSSNIALILSGSQIGMIEDVISYKKPLYGRTTFRLKIRPFDYSDSAKFYPGFSNEDRIRAYGVFGGIPHYLSKVDDQIPLKDNIVNLILREDGILADETEFFLRQELRAVSSYSMIIHAIANGATRLNEISTKGQIHNTGTTTKFIDTLRGLDIIEKEVCFGEGEKSKRTLYRLKDNFFHFYFTYIQSNQSKRALLEPATFYEVGIAESFDEYTSFIFEKVCREFLVRTNVGSGEHAILEVGRYWGNNKKLKREVEIDIATRSAGGIAVYECKWTKKVFGKEEVQGLKNESEILDPYMLGGFSRRGFSAYAKEKLHRAYRLDDLFEV